MNQFGAFSSLLWHMWIDDTHSPAREFVDMKRQCVRYEGERGFDESQTTATMMTTKSRLNTPQNRIQPTDERRKKLFNIEWMRGLKTVYFLVIARTLLSSPSQRSLFIAELKKCQYLSRDYGLRSIFRIDSNLCFTTQSLHCGGIMVTRRNCVSFKFHFIEQSHSLSSLLE